MKLFRIEHHDRFEVHHWFAPSQSKLANMFIAWCDERYGDTPQSFSTSRVRVESVLSFQRNHLKEALDSKLTGLGSYAPDDGWLIEPL